MLNSKIKPAIFFIIATLFCAKNIFSQNMAPLKGQKILVFSKTAGFRHASIGVGKKYFQELAAKEGFVADTTENSQKFTEQNLKQYKVVVFLSTTGDVLNDTQQLAFERFIQAGGGFVGIHAASDTEYDWPWYNNLVGMMFKIHPQQQTAYLNVVNSDFPGMERFPKKMLWTDEWYDFKEILAKDLTYLVKIDEKSYNPYAKWGNNESKGMGDFHPISWYHKYDGGRAFYTALGHIGLVYSDQTFLDHLYGGIYWAATGKGL